MMDDEEFFKRSMASFGVKALDGNASDGNASDGNAPDGNAPDGNASDGNAPDGDDHAAGRSVEFGFAEVERQMFRQALQELDPDPWDESPDVPSDVPRHQSSVRRLKASGKGQRVDDQIDLHRLRSAEALQRLEVFVHRCAAARARKVLVITGKGHHSPGGRGVLKQRVEEWIRGPGRRYVSAYAEAPRALGGRGAYVLSLRQSPRGV